MRTKSRGRSIMICFLAIVLVGCTAVPPEHLPTYQWMDNAASIQLMARRSELVRIVNCACFLTLIRADGQSVHLDGALAMDLPQKDVRIRAWKFNQPVFDLTLARDELWLEMPKDEQRRSEVLPAGLSAAQFARALSLFGPDFLDDPHLSTVDDGGAEFELRKRIDQNREVVALVRRSTLTIRQYRLLDSAARSQFILDLSHYESIGEIVWPTQMEAINDGSKIELGLRDIQINTALPASAFVPPRGAERLP